MGEFAPIVILIFVSLVIVAVMLLKKHLDSRMVVKPLVDADLIERDRYQLTVKEATELSEILKNLSITSAQDNKAKSASLILHETEDHKTRMLTFTVK